MNQIPEVLFGTKEHKTWLIVGASRGIGLAFVRHLLASEDSRIFATVREERTAQGLWLQAGSDHGRCQMLICDVLSEQSINVNTPPIPALFDLALLVPLVHSSLRKNSYCMACLQSLTDWSKESRPSTCRSPKLEDRLRYN